MNTMTQRLMRSRSDKMIAGVAGGIGTYLAIDPLIIRLIFVFLLFSGIGPFIYGVLWLIMPVEPDNVSQTSADQTDAATPSPVDPHIQRNWTLGAVLVALGAFLILSKLLPWVYPFIIPALFIAAGILLLRRASRGF